GTSRWRTWWCDSRPTPTCRCTPTRTTGPGPSREGRTVSAPLDAVVVGSGPNGLAAAVALAMAGRSVTVLESAAVPGGGARSAELTVPGLVHDTCSGVHPF